ncbi:MAG: enoyl-CoA hydratase-related protein [Acidobacteriota bacterium]
MAEYETVLYGAEKGVATITLNRPDVLNAFNDQMIEDTHSALKAAQRDEGIRCLVVTGNGRAFSSGQDLGAVREREEALSFGEHLRARYNPLIRTMRTLEKPIIASVNGVAAGAGCSLALACDLRIVSEGATLIEVFINVGLIPDTGSTFFLPRMVGASKAFEWAVTAHHITAEEAQRWGIANVVVPPDRLQETSQEWAERLAQAPTKAIALTKRALNRSWALSLDEALEYEAMLQEVAGRTEDHAEGVAAFLEKREPRFQGR